MGWNPTELHLDAHKYTEETQAGGIGFRVPYPVVVPKPRGFRVTYPVMVPNRAPFRQKSPGDCTRPLLNQYQA